MVRLAVGTFWGIALGIPLGILVGLSARAHAALWPPLLFFQAIGDIAWLPILVIWFGYGLTTMTVIIVYTVIFPVVLNTVLGVRSIPINMHRAALSLGASRARLLWEVVLPGALPNIITGLRNGLGYGWRALIATEMGHNGYRVVQMNVNSSHRQPRPMQMRAMAMEAADAAPPPAIAAGSQRVEVSVNGTIELGKP